MQNPNIKKINRESKECPKKLAKWHRGFPGRASHYYW